MKQQLADYLNANTAELKATQRKNITLADIDAQIARTADPIATDLLYKERDRIVAEALRAPKAVLDSIRRNKTLASTARKWKELANEAIADAQYWKNETRKLQEALRDIRDCAYDPSQVAEVTFDSGKLAARIYAVAKAALEAREGVNQ